MKTGMGALLDSGIDLDVRLACLKAAEYLLTCLPQLGELHLPFDS